MMILGGGTSGGVSGWIEDVARGSAWLFFSSGRP